MQSPDRPAEARSRTQKAVEAAQRVADGQKVFRSTEPQRQTFLEGLYSDYAELHRQAQDLQERKQRMETDGFTSNNREIHTLLFANVSANEEELGDWDTWERVESVVKKFAYGRSSGTGENSLSENRALQARLDTLLHTTATQRKKVATLTRSMTSVQEELQGLLNLLQMKDRSVRTLTSKNNTLNLQVRQLERECSLLRGEKKKREETEQLFSDVKYLIDVNKQLENENVDLRGKLRAAVSQPAKATPRQAAEAARVAGTNRAATNNAVANNNNNNGATSNAAAPAPQDSDDSLEASALPRFLSFHLDGDHPDGDDDLHSLLEVLGDDTKRRAYIASEAPMTGMVMDVKRSRVAWMARLEAEVGNAMAALDLDAGITWEASAVPAMKRTDSTESLVFDFPAVDGAFTGYEGYKRPSLLAPSVGGVRVTVAPAVSTDMRSAAARQAGKVAVTSAQGTPQPSGGEVPYRVPPQSDHTSGSGSSAGGGAGGGGESRSSPLPPPAAGRETFLTTGERAAAPLKAPSTTTTRGGMTSSAAFHGASGVSSSPTSGPGLAVSPSSVAGAGVRALQRTVVGLAEYSRRECLRREVLHVNQLRRRLAEARARLEAGDPSTATGPATSPAREDASRASDAAAASLPDGATDALTTEDPLHTSGRTPSPVLRSSLADAQAHATEEASSDPAGAASPNQFDDTMKAAQESALPSPDEAGARGDGDGSGGSASRHLDRYHAHSLATEDGKRGAAVAGCADGWPSEVRLLREHLATTRDECDALRSELRAFFAFMGELLFEITSAVPNRPAEEAAQRRADADAVRAMESMADVFVTDAVELRVRQTLLAQHNLVLPPAKPITDDMPDEEWLEQKLRGMALQAAMRHVHEEEAATPKTVRPAAGASGGGERGGLAARRDSPTPHSLARGGPSTASVHGGSKSVSRFVPSHVSGGPLEQSAFYRDILCGMGDGPLSADSFLRGQALEGWPVPQPMDWPQGVHSAGASQVDNVSAPFLMGVDDLYLRGRPANGMAVPDRPGDGGTGSGTGSGARNALDFFPAPDATTAPPPLQSGSPFVLHGHRIAPAKSAAAPHPQANQWYYHAHGPAYAAASPEDEAKQKRLVGGYRNQKTTRNVLQLLRSLQPRRMPGAEDQLQPDVYRYNITTTMQRAVKEANARRNTAMQHLLAPQFDEYVARFVMPLASAAAQAKRLVGGARGGVKDAALVSAIQALRTQERERRREHTKLVFSRVANNIRTRQLLQRQPRNVEKGNAFTNYVAILYDRWRAQLDRQTQQNAIAKEANDKQLLRLIGLRTESTSSSAPSLPSLASPSQHRLPSISPPAAGSASARAAKPGPSSRTLGPSSFHFETASFRPTTKKM